MVRILDFQQLPQTSTDDGGDGIQQTKCHDLVLQKKWNELTERLGTEEGRKEARIMSPIKQLIFHMEEIFEAPVHVLRAAHEAYPQGWLTPFDPIYANAKVYPIVNFIAFKSDEASLKFMLETFPTIARQSCWCGEFQNYKKRNFLPLQYACIAGYNAGIRLLLEAYPEAVALQDEEGALPIFLGCRELSFESMRLLLAAYPEAVHARDHYGDTLLHKIFDKEMFDFAPVCEKTARMIFDAFPDAAVIGGRRGNLPVHYALSNREASSIKLADSMINAFPHIASKKSGSGHLPLHDCCEHFILCKQADEALFRNLVLFRKLLHLYPDAIAIRNGDGRLPIECLVEEVDEIKDFAFPHLTRCFEMLLRAYPGALLPSKEVEKANAFVLFVSKRPDVPLSTWKLVASMAPQAILGICDDQLLSPLSYSLMNDHLYLHHANYLDGTNAAILEVVVRALWQLFGVKESIGGFCMLELGDTFRMSINSHMFAFCCHLLKDVHAIPKLLGNDEMLDLKGNLPIHALCFAPCPLYTYEYDLFKDRDMNYIEHYLESLPKELRNRILMKRNNIGELPLHVLLRNKNARLITFDDDIKTLALYSPLMVTAWNPSQRLYPFMQAAMNVQKRSPEASCSTTYMMLHSFITCGSLTEFSKVECSHVTRQNKRARYS